MKKLFLDLSRLTREDWELIKAIARAFNLDLNEAIQAYMYEKPGKIKVLGEMENGNIHVDEITSEGVTEYNGADAFRKILEQVRKNKGEK